MFSLAHLILIGFSSLSLAQEPIENPQTEQFEPPVMSEPAPVDINESLDLAADSEGEPLGPRSFGLSARLIFPEILGVAATWRPTERWQIGVEAARFWVPFWLGNTGIRTLGFFTTHNPFDGAFYVGGTLGEQRLNLDVGASILGFKTGISSEVKTLYLRGFFGWQWIYESGFSWGFRFGLQAPLEVRSGLSLAAAGASESDLDDIRDTSEYRRLEAKVKEVGDVVGGTWLPTFSLLHIGWYF